MVIRTLLFLFLFFSVYMVFPQSSFDAESPSAGEEALTVPFINLDLSSLQNNSGVATTVQLLVFLTILSLAPSIVILLTSFMRIAIVLNFVKRAISLQDIPPNQVVMGIALFLTLFTMWPTIQNVYDNAFVPLRNGEIELNESYEEFAQPIRLFMYRQMRSDGSYIRLFMRMANLADPAVLADVPSYVLIPAFILHELNTAFKIGILLFIPFVVIDIITASVLMSMGMIMLPPVMISLPLKLALFILVDGWGLLVEQLILSFGGR